MTAAVVTFLLPGGRREEEVVEVLEVLERGPLSGGKRGHKIRRESGEVRWVPGDWVGETA